MSKIIIENVSKVIKGAEVLKDINAVFENEHIYGIYGYNGSGKTMLLRVLSGLINPTSGRIMIDDKELHKDIDYPNSVGVLIETPNFWANYTGREVLKTLADLKGTIGKDEIDDALVRVGLDPNDKRIIKKYSLGMRQRLGIAQAIMEKPDIILLDEPTNSLDKNGIKLIHNILLEEYNRGAVVVIASHNTEDMNICDIKFEMYNGILKEDEIVK